MSDAFGMGVVPIQNNGFTIDLGGDKGLWTSVSGLTSEINVVDVEANSKAGKQLIKGIPGERTFGEVTFTRYATPDMSMYKWFEDVVVHRKKDQFKHITITLLDYSGSAAGEVSLIKALPVSVKYGDHSADSAEAQTETITIAFESWERVN